ncbi:hypothetical protein V4V35_25380 [Bacillus infantis]
MYEVVTQTPKEVFTVYIMFLAACIVTYPIIRLITTAADRGLSKWK